MKTLVVVIAVLVALAAISMVKIEGELIEAPGTSSGGPTMDLSSYSADAPGLNLNFLFIHHSIGGQLLADPGEEAGASSIHPTHPNGGGLRKLLEADGYRVHEAAYHSEVGHETDLRHWVPKFQSQLERILHTRMQDELLAEGERNHVVAFKSCYPCSRFVGQGTAPGDAGLSELTVENAKAALRELLPVFQSQPDTLFVYFTAPPVAPRMRPQPAWKKVLKSISGRGQTAAKRVESARLARSFNDWTKATDGWLADYEGNNVVVFDYFDVLTDGGASDLLAFPTKGGVDSHPSSEGQRKAAAVFAPFLNRAVRRAGLTE